MAVLNKTSKYANNVNLQTFVNTKQNCADLVTSWESIRITTQVLPLRSHFKSYGFSEPFHNLRLIYDTCLTENVFFSMY